MRVAIGALVTAADSDVEAVEVVEEELGSVGRLTADCIEVLLTRVIVPWLGRDERVERGLVILELDDDGASDCFLLFEAGSFSTELLGFGREFADDAADSGF